MHGIHRRQVALAVWLAPGLAHAGHDMAMMGGDHAGEPELALGVSVVAATYDNPSYVGSYQGVAPTVAWSAGRVGAAGQLGLYHLDQNGLSTYGIGDASLAGHVAIVATEALDAGAALHVMLPTGSERDHLGMGHTMAMAAAWASWHARPLTIAASAGYARALVELADGGHDHGPMPLVDPMNLQELTWSAAVDVDVGRGVQLGGRALGGVAIGAGSSRAIAGGRVAWQAARVTTGFELQVGLAGDPFTLRGLVETALRF